MLLPLACSWAEEQEAVILRTGVPLSHSMLEVATKLGISEPHRVRLLAVDRIPLPGHPALRSAAEQTDLITPLTAGLTLRYGIFIRSDCRSDRHLLIHELAHVAQYERLGGFRPFLERYLYECIDPGYPLGDLEQEATRAESLYC